MPTIDRHQHRRINPKQTAKGHWYPDFTVSQDTTVKDIDPNNPDDIGLVKRMEQADIEAIKRMDKEMQEYLDFRYPKETE